MKFKLLPSLVVAALSVTAATQAQAGGYRVALQGQKALGMGHTGD